jgi:hypothetical protein
LGCFVGIATHLIRLYVASTRGIRRSNKIKS